MFPPAASRNQYHFADTILNEILANPSYRLTFDQI